MKHLGANKEGLDGTSDTGLPLLLFLSHAQNIEAAFIQSLFPKLV